MKERERQIGEDECDWEEEDECDWEELNVEGGAEVDLVPWSRLGLGLGLGLGQLQSPPSSHR